MLTMECSAVVLVHARQFGSKRCLPTCMLTGSGRWIWALEKYAGTSTKALTPKDVKVGGISSSTVKAEKGARINVDRTYALKDDLPTALAGSILVQTPHDFPAGKVVTITAPGAYTVYAAMYSKAGRDAGYSQSLKGAGWSSMTTSVAGTHTVYNMWRLTSKGTTTLPRTTKSGIVFIFVKASANVTTPQSNGSWLTPTVFSTTEQVTIVAVAGTVPSFPPSDACL